jgi:ribosomal-protein-alanine N-acetyltransferase
MNNINVMRTVFLVLRNRIQRLWSKVDVRNIASCRMLEKCGYTKEG